MRRHRWWLALLATLCTPIPGPHLDHALPLGMMLFLAVVWEADRTMIVAIAAGTLVVYAGWFVLLGWLAARRARRAAGKR